MGINNLSSFITEYGLKKPYKLCDTYVVFDGYNICYVLYAQFSKEKPNDFLFGGNYTEYHKLYENFLQNLRQCNITPIVVFNGEINPNVNHNRMERFKQTLDELRQLSDNPPKLPLRTPIKGIEHKTNPRLLKMLFKSVAKMMEIECFTIESNADLELAKLAIHLDCPLVTNDSDFFVMDIKRGVISIESMKWQNPLKLDQSKHYIECQVYKVEDLLQFKNPNDYQNKQIEMKAEMLPIFASLLGSDGFDDQLLYGLFEEIAEQTKRYSLITDRLKKSRLFKHMRWRRMDQLICWLAFRFSNANEAILHIESYCRLSRNPRAIQLFRDSIKNFDTNGKSVLKELLDNKMMATNNNENPIENIENEDKLSNSFRSVMESFAQSLKVPELRIKKPLIEDFSLESTFESSIRLKGFHLGLCRTDRKDETPVYFIIRKGNSYEEILIPPKTLITGTTDGNKQLPIKSEIKNLSEIERKRLLFDILEFKEQWMTDLEADLNLIKLQTKDIEFWKYFLIVITYWKFNSKIKKFQSELIQSFVQKLIYFRHNSQIKNDFKGMTSVKFCSRKQLQLFVIHYYCEIQSIYSSIDKLISLLDNPIVGHSLHLYFNGILLYNLFNQITANPNNSSPFKDDKLNKLYNIIIDSILKTNN